MIDPATYAKDTEHSQQVSIFIHIGNLTAAMNAARNARAPETDHVGDPHLSGKSWSFQNIEAMRLLFAIPLGGNRDAKVGADLKAEGVKAGVPDLFLPVPIYANGAGPEVQYHGLWIEMKRPPTARQKAGTIAPTQAKWHADLIGQGFAVCVCYTWLEAVETLWKYLNGRLEKTYVER